MGADSPGQVCKERLIVSKLASVFKLASNSEVASGGCKRPYFYLNRLSVRHQECEAPYKIEGVVQRRVTRSVFFVEQYADLAKSPVECRALGVDVSHESGQRLCLCPPVIGMVRVHAPTEVNLFRPGNRDKSRYVGQIRPQRAGVEAEARRSMRYMLSGESE